MASPETSNVDPPLECIIPAGTKLLTSIPDLLMIPELVFGGLVWILVASIQVFDKDSQGWVMFVSILCFVLTLLLLICYFTGWPRNSTAWCFLDVVYHGASALFYFSAAVLQANSTVRLQFLNGKVYQIDVAATWLCPFSLIAATNPWEEVRLPRSEETSGKWLAIFLDAICSLVGSCTLFYEYIGANQVFTFAATVLYVVHAVFSFKRWKTV